jgi:hypothetical protein
MLPQPLIEEYWEKVRELLRKDYCLDEQQSNEAVSVYRQVVEPKVGPMLYHEDATRIASTVFKMRNNPSFV